MHSFVAFSYSSNPFCRHARRAGTDTRDVALATVIPEAPHARCENLPERSFGLAAQTARFGAVGRNLDDTV